MAAYGDGYRFHVTGLTHNETGFPTNAPAVSEALVRRLYTKVEDDVDNIVINETFMADDAEVLFVAYGSVARTSLYLVKQLRAKGIKAGLFIPKVLWPFPEKALKALLTDKVKHVIVPEMNLGQYVLEVERHVAGKCPTTCITKVSGELFKTDEIYDKVMAVINR
jgi:2-oxoglutarate ferredoxin oxidoreductase subunit alpha